MPPFWERHSYRKKDTCKERRPLSCSTEEGGHATRDKQPSPIPQVDQVEQMH